MERKAVIIGATSGIGRALAEELHSRGYALGLTGRRVERLEELKNSLGKNVKIQFMDVTKTRDAIDQLEMLIRELKHMDIIVLNAGVSNFRGSTMWKTEKRVIDVNIRGFTALANYSFDYFEKKGNGHIVGISSVAGHFGYGLSAAYNASKAFVSTYLQGYRQRANHSKADIAVTDIIPGFVESEMTDGKPGMFWVAGKDKAARQIANAIESRKNRAYITKRWWLVGWVLKLVPNWVLDRI
ncbi:SDR family NAD(P)-dependent oxidoreductase [Balneolaceae bacterium YR4-1]|uniref:SDR family NAD(P)-dependent oxidoreductase n=1 Tax=Halalkalibaculum roseum TaxID=2709311 RepID=A0A6M1SYQ1_9BACT|nr:SDR family NAD(P)-dependent oxidoreductase [Halalkalibaculum roseum]NGP77448.1 SDR family NAD(P)-dependent oxidoreductase [Halalkalibaculum roseum]